MQGGCTALQYRNKHAQAKQKETECAELSSLCRHFGTTFIVNDNPELAKKSRADGVHLGQTDSPISSAREFLGNQYIIGATCHSDLNYASKAVQQGADYLAFGRFFKSKTKPNAPLAKLSTLQSASEKFAQPLVAIGGISLENACKVIRAGADNIAVCDALFAAQNIKQQAAQFASLFIQ